MVPFASLRTLGEGLREVEHESAEKVGKNVLGPHGYIYFWPYLCKHFTK